MLNYIPHCLYTMPDIYTMRTKYQIICLRTNALDEYMQGSAFLCRPTRGIAC